MPDSSGKSGKGSKSSGKSGKSSGYNDDGWNGVSASKSDLHFSESKAYNGGVERRIVGAMAFVAAGAAVLVQ